MKNVDALTTRGFTTTVVVVANANDLFAISFVCFRCFKRSMQGANCLLTMLSMISDISLASLFFRLLKMYVNFQFIFIYEISI